MKNLLNEKPSKILYGRLLASVNFVEDNDIKNREVLDIGCGYGWCELNFLNRGVKKIIGTEISEEDLKAVKENIDDDRLGCEVCGATELPFDNEIFNTVVSWEVLEHIPKKTENMMFNEVNRVLKKGGIFYFSTPNSTFFSNIFDPAWWLIGHRHYSEKRLVDCANKNNFEVLSIEIKGGWWSLFSTLNMYVSKWIFRRKSFFTNLVDNKTNQDYQQNKGFVNIFMKLRKKNE